MSPDIGQVLRHVRESRNLSRGKLAEMTGLTVQAIAQVETGLREPSFRTLVGLACGLKTSLDSIVGFVPGKEIPNAAHDAGLSFLTEKIRRLPLESQKQVEEFVEFLWMKKGRRSRNRK